MYVSMVNLRSQSCISERAFATSVPLVTDTSAVSMNGPFLGFGRGVQNEVVSPPGRIYPGLLALCELSSPAYTCPRFNEKANALAFWK